jgi:hypothetical protein
MVLTIEVIKAAARPCPDTSLINIPSLSESLKCINHRNLLLPYPWAYKMNE